MAGDGYVAAKGLGCVEAADGITLHHVIRPEGAVVAEDATVGRIAVVLEDAVEEEYWDGSRSDTLGRQRREDPALHPHIPPVDLHRAVIAPPRPVNPPICFADADA